LLQVLDAIVDGGVNFLLQRGIDPRLLRCAVNRLLLLLSSGVVAAWSDALASSDFCAASFFGCADWLPASLVGAWMPTRTQPARMSSQAVRQQLEIANIGPS
jgi:hypothetical protein